MFVVGLTGGIGSGKTAVSDRFAAQGIEIVDADLASRVVVEPGTQALRQIQRHFGDSVLLEDGQLDRAGLRSLVFSDPEQKAWLEKLLHPLIGAEIYRQLEAARSPYVMFVSPLLIEAGQAAICDRIVVVDVPEAVQLERTMQRDQNSEEQVRNIISSQADRRQRLDAATDVIENTGSLQDLDRHVAELHQRFVQLAREHDADG